MRRIEKFSFAFMVAGILCITVIFSPDILAASKNPCSRDIVRFCKNANFENNGIIQCLEEHESELSQACRNYKKKLKAEAETENENSKEKDKTPAGL